MPTLPPSRIATLLAPYHPPLPPETIEKLSQYLDLLLRWNAHTNLTAIRDPEEIVRRHFGESLFTAHHLPNAETLLDLGSGAGFPGLPIQLALPALKVTLAESQNKKATFLREVIRTLALPTLGFQIQVHAARVETLPATALFDVVALRAVDNPTAALTLARQRLAPGGTIAHLSSEPHYSQATTLPIPNSLHTSLHLYTFPPS